jgi:signal transduction histidine kinase
VNDILDFSKLEAGKVSLKDFNFDLQACVESVCDVLVLQAQKKGIELVCYVDTSIPTYVRGDPGMLLSLLSSRDSQSLTDPGFRHTQAG